MSFHNVIVVSIDNVKFKMPYDERNVAIKNFLETVEEINEMQTPFTKEDIENYIRISNMKEPMTGLDKESLFKGIIVADFFGNDQLLKDGCKIIVANLYNKTDKEIKNYLNADEKT